MLTPTVVAAPTLQAQVTELHHDIAHLVAAALDAGGVTWQVAAPLVHDLLDRDWNGVAPVVVARALGRAQARQAAILEHALAQGEVAAAQALTADLEHARSRLADLLATPDRP